MKLHGRIKRALRAFGVAIVIAAFGLATAQASPLRETVRHYFNIADMPMSCEAQENATIVDQGVDYVTAHHTTYPAANTAVLCDFTLPDNAAVTEFSGHWAATGADLHGGICLSSGSPCFEFVDLANPSDLSTSNGDVDFGRITVSDYGPTSGSATATVSGIVLDGYQDEVCGGECPEGGGWGPGGWTHFDADFIRPVRDADVLDDITIDTFSTLLTTAEAPVFMVGPGVVGRVVHEPEGYVVDVRIGSQQVSYYNLRSTFVEAGDQLTAGCVIGYAGEPAPGSPVGSSKVVYVADEAFGDWHTYEESLTALPCGSTAATCLNANPDFDNNGDGWSSRFAIADHLNNAGDEYVSLPPTGQVYQPFLDGDIEETYVVTVVAANETGFTNGEVTATIWGTESVMAVSSISDEYITLTSTGLSLSTGPHEFQVTNTYPGSNTLRITFACVSLTEPIIAPPACYFTSDIANLRIDGWEQSAGVVYTPPGFLGIGKYTIPDGDWIRTPVDFSAYADADTDFTLTIDGVATSALAVPTLTASIVDSDTDELLYAIDDYVLPIVLYQNVSHGFTVGSAEHVVGDLLIENNTGGGESATVDAFCLQSDTGIWPGYANADYTSDGGLLPSDCTQCNIPVDVTDVPGWLAWIGCILRYLLYCLIYTLVNRIWGTIISAVIGLGLLGRWLSAAAAAVALWAYHTLTYLFAQLFARAIPIINSILAWLLTLPFVQSVLDTAALAGVFFEGVWAFITGVLNLFVAAVQFIGVLLSLVGAAWSAFIAALSESSAITFPFPNCSDPETTFYDACLPLDVLNFFASEVPAVLAMFGAIALVIVWKKVRQAITTVREVFA